MLPISSTDSSFGSPLSRNKKCYDVRAFFRSFLHEKIINSKKVFAFSDSAVNSDGCDKNMNGAYVGVYVNTDTKVCGYLYEYAPTPQVASMINLC